MPKKPKNKRGGKRAGSGRPKLPDGEGRVPLNATVLPRTRLAIIGLMYERRERENGELASMGEVLDWLAAKHPADE